MKSFSELFRPKGKDEQQFVDAHKVDVIDNLIPGEHEATQAPTIKGKAKRSADVDNDVAAYGAMPGQSKKDNPTIDPTTKVVKLAKEAVEAERTTRRGVKRADKKPVIVHYVDPKTHQSKAKVVMKRAGTIYFEDPEHEDLDESTLSAKAGREGKDLGKKGKNFSKIADKAGKEYGSKKAGERVAGAILAKMRAKHFKEETEVLSEKLNSSMGVKKYIDDFQSSKNPRFEGKSKEKRRKMAIAAFYADKMKESFQLDELSKDTLGRYATKAHNRGDIAARMSHSDSDDMGKIANKRSAGAQLAVKKMGEKTGKTERASRAASNIKSNIDNAKKWRTDKDASKKANTQYSLAQKRIASLRNEEADIEDLLSSLYEALDDKNKAIMEQMLEQNQVEELIEFAKEVLDE